MWIGDDSHSHRAAISRPLSSAARGRAHNAVRANRSNFRALVLRRGGRTAHRTARGGAKPTESATGRRSGSAGGGTGPGRSPWPTRDPVLPQAGGAPADAGVSAVPGFQEPDCCTQQLLGDARLGPGSGPRGRRRRQPGITVWLVSRPETLTRTGVRLRFAGPGVSDQHGRWSAFPVVAGGDDGQSWPWPGAVGSRPRPGLPVVTAGDHGESRPVGPCWSLTPSMQISAARRFSSAFFGPAHKPDGMRECRVDATADHLEALTAAIPGPGRASQEAVGAADRVPGSPEPRSRPRLGAPPACGRTGSGSPRTPAWAGSPPANTRSTPPG